MQTLTEEYQATDSAGSVIYSSDPYVYVQGAYGYTDIVVPDNPGFAVAYNGELAPRWNYWSYNPLGGLNFASGSGNTPGSGSSLASGATGTADNPIGNPPPNARFDITTPPSLVPDSPPTNVTPASKASPQTPPPIKPLPPNLQTPKKSDLKQWNYWTTPEVATAGGGGAVNSITAFNNSFVSTVTLGRYKPFQAIVDYNDREAAIWGDTLAQVGYGINKVVGTGAGVAGTIAVTGGTGAFGQAVGLVVAGVTTYDGVTGAVDAYDHGDKIGVAVNVGIAVVGALGVGAGVRQLGSVVEPLPVAVGASAAERAAIQTGPYRSLVNDLKGTGLQANHLNQRAAFKTVIPPNEGLSVGMRGNALYEVGSPHYKFHSELEELYAPFRKNGIFQGQRPTNAQYGEALERALFRSGFTRAEAARIADQAAAERAAYRLKPSDPIPVLPRRMPQAQGH